MNNDILVLQPHRQADKAASVGFDRFMTRWQPLMPATVVFEHIGATAIRGCLTKGDVDICLRVDALDFDRVGDMLSGHFARNPGSFQSDQFAAFMDDGWNPPLGIQLVVKQSELDIFVCFRDRLRNNPRLLAAYNALKRQYVGCPMDDYRRKKATFIRCVIA